MFQTMRTSRQRRLRGAFFLAVGIGATGLTLLVYAFGLFDGFERQTVDYRFAIRGVRERPEMVMVAIDQPSLDRLGDWPLKRSIHGRVIDRLREDGAKVIAYDVEFSDPTVAREDLALYQAIGRAHGKVVLASTEVGPDGTTNVLGGPANLQAVGAAVGESQLPADRFAVLRRMDYSILGLKNFAVVAAERANGRPLRDVGTAWIDYAGPPRTIASVPMWKVVRGDFPRGTFRGKVVVVGASAPLLQDRHATPTSGSDLMAGVEIQANQIATAIRGFPLRSAPSQDAVLVIALLGLVTPLLSIRRSALVAAGASVALGALHAFATQLAFDHGLVVSFVYPLMALALASLGALSLHLLFTAFDREHVRDLFARFVPEQVVDQVLARTDGDLRLGGRELVATVMFSDLRGFTTSVETMHADHVIEVLNRYLGAMSDAVLENGGTLVSYMGDGIMAVFGAPIEQPDHADRALAAAVEMLDVRLPRVNTWLREHGLGEGYKMGIGLNTGPVMSGNVGHTRRLEYTAVGDTVNTASRIEGMTKGTPYSVFVADSTHALLRSAERLEEVGELEVRGRAQKLRVWGLAARGSASPLRAA
jgi:adenylate cyclase